MNARVVVSVFVTIVVIAALVGVGVYVFNIGVMQGMAQAGRLPAPSTEPIPAPYLAGPYFFRPWGFGFGCFGILIPLFFLFVIFALFRGLFFGGHWRRRAWMREGNVPPMFEEWHKKAHEKQT